VQRSACCSGRLRYIDDGLSDAVLHPFLHCRAALLGLGAVLVVFRLLLSHRLPADRVPYGIYLADDFSGRSEVRIRLLLDTVKGASEVVFDARCRVRHRQCLHGSRGVTGLPAW